MALFNSKKNTKKDVPAKAAPTERVDNGEHSLALARPWFSEKALIGTEHGVYVFVIPAHTTKQDVAYAIEKVYKVKPVKVRIANLPAKKKPMRTRRGVGVRARRHKAYVYLKKGDTISFA